MTVSTSTADRAARPAAGRPTVTATRLCATCGREFTWTSRNPNKRFCDPKCKAAWWRKAHDETTGDNVLGADTTPSTARTANAVTATTTVVNGQTTSLAGPDGVRDEVRTANAVTSPYGSGYDHTDPTPGTTQTCPNCHQPVAVINLLITPAAAFVNTPTQSVTDHHTNHSLNSL